MTNGDRTYQVTSPSRCRRGVFPSVTLLVLMFASLAGAQTFLDVALYPAGADPEGIVTADFNRDGKMDVVVTNYEGASISVLLGKGDGTLKSHVDYATTPFPNGLTVGDFNSDGNPDLAVSVFGPIEPTCVAPVLAVFLGKGDGTFRPRVDYPTGCGPDGVAVGDFNDDRKQDLVTADAVDGTLSVFLGNGNGTFQPRLVFPAFSADPGAVATGDFNGDGKADLATGNGVGQIIGVFLGNGDGTFQAGVGYGPEVLSESSNVLLADFNEDGNTDMVVAIGESSADQILVFLGRGDGTFQDPLVSSALGFAGALAPGDFNGDGHSDLVSNGAFNSAVILLGRGDGTFDSGAFSYIGGGAAAVTDLNNDGKADVVTGTGQSYDAVGVLLGNGDGTLQSCKLFNAVGLSPVVADFNRDGLQDVATTNTLLLGNADGTLQPPILYNADGAAAVVGDFNGDGNPDTGVSIFVVGNGSWVVTVFLGNGDGTFRPQQDYLAGSGIFFLTTGDVNRDGKTDLITSNSWDNTVSILLGNGDGTFRSPVNYATGTGPGPIAVADFNGDGKPDIVDLSQTISSLNVLLGNGDGTFQAHSDRALNFNGNALAVADFNSDGREDLAITAEVDQDHKQVSVFLGNGDGTFQDPTNYAAGLGFSVIAADFNGDLKIDLAVPDPVEVSLLLGNGDGTFQQERVYPVAQGFPMYAVGDFNADGRPDLVATDGAVVSVPLNIADMPIFTLSLTLSGSGAGTVTTNPEWVSCSSNCSRKFANGTTVTLTAHPDPGASFTGWSGGGCSGTGTCSLTLTSDQTVTATFDLTPDFALAVSDFAPNPISPGQSSTSTVSASGANGFGDTVSLTCSVQPSGAHAPQCSVSPNSITPGNSATVTITTTAPTAAQVLPSGSPSGVFYALWLPVAGLALAGTGFRSRRQKKPKVSSFLFCSLLVIGLVFQSACGGGTSPGGGTPPGTYTITVTGTSGSLSHSTTVNLKVE